MATALTNLLGLDLKGLEGFFIEIGEKPFRARQLLQWIHQYRVTDFAQIVSMTLFWVVSQWSVPYIAK